MKGTTSRGFTLIELLIVVAIIAILAAIAVPNFLEAQTRSKVSRAKADLRSMATAMEAYVIDYNKYPPSGITNPSPPPANLSGMILLSTPVSYVTDAYLEDPFGNARISGQGVGTETAGKGLYFYLSIQSLSANEGGTLIIASFPGDTSKQIATTGLRYTLWSRGPDRLFQCQAINPPSFDCGGVQLVQWMRGLDVAIGIYDPTNGTVSMGDIYRTAKGDFIPAHMAD